MGATAMFLLTRHGRDVILPPFTEMDVSLNHAVSLETLGRPFVHASVGSATPELP
jgi:hypothetical protein